MSERLSDQYRLVGTLSVHHWGAPGHPGTVALGAFIRIEDGRIAVTPPQRMADVEFRETLPEFPWVEGDPTGKSADEYIDAQIAALLDCRRMYNEANPGEGAGSM